MRRAAGGPAVPPRVPGVRRRRRRPAKALPRVPDRHVPEAGGVERRCPLKDLFATRDAIISPCGLYRYRLSALGRGDAAGVLHHAQPLDG